MVTASSSVSSAASVVALSTLDGGPVPTVLMAETR